MKEIPKPLNPDYFDINVLCWRIPINPKSISIFYPNAPMNEQIN